MLGCIPSKALLHASHLYHEASHEMSSWGINNTGLSVDLQKMMDRKTSSVNGLTQGIEHLFKKYGVTYIKGEGSFKDKNTILVNGKEEISTKNTVIATGSEPIELPFLRFDEEKIVSSTGALSLKEVPKKLAVIGGGVIGLELGSVWGRLGSEVQVIEFADQICPNLDVEVSKTFKQILTKQGLKFMMSTKVVSGEKNNKGGVTLQVEPVSGGEKKSLDFDVVLVSVGRRAFTKGLGLENIGVKTDKQGRIEVNDHLFTGVEGIYAIGDCIRGPMLAHKAEDEGIAIAEYLAGGVGHVNYDAIPGVIYTSPEVADVGKTEQKLKAEGIEYRVGKFPMMANSRARTIGRGDGFVKVLTDAKTDRILGVSIIGECAGELIAEATLALEYGASAEDLARTVHAHPTFAEASREAYLMASSAFGKAIHF